MEDSTNVDYVQAKRFCKDFVVESLGQYHDLFVQSCTWLLVNMFENFQNVSLEMYELDPDHFISVPAFCMASSFEKIKVKLDLLIDTDMLLMVEKVIKSETCHAFHR